MQKVQDKLETLADQARLEKEQAVRDRAELVTPAPAGFKPKAKGRMLALTLVPQKKMIRVGETFWYRAEIQNVGSERVDISDSFIKSGYDYYGAKFKIIVSPRHWKDHSVLRSANPCYSESLPVPGWERMDSSQRAAATKRYILEETVLRSHVDIVLNPGDTVRTRDEKYVSPEEDCAAFQAGQKASDRPGGLFRQYFETRDFGRPGTYTLKLVLSDPVTPMPAESRSNLERHGFSADEIAAQERSLDATHLGSAESPPVTIEVVR